MANTDGKQQCVVYCELRTDQRKEREEMEQSLTHTECDDDKEEG